MAIPDLHGDDLDGYGIVMEIMLGGSSTRLNAIRPYGMDVTGSMTLDMCKSPHLMIFYLQKDEQGDLKDKSQGWISDIGG